MPNGVAHVEGEVTPATEKVRTAKRPLIELKIHGARNNPRFLFVVCSDVAVFLTAFAKKSQKLRRPDVARADDRFQTMKDGCS
jgi:phage-related protein